MDDRGVRKTIATLRAEMEDDDYVILSTSHSPSVYWRSNDPAEIQEFIRETEARARNTFESIRTAKRILRQAERRQSYGEPLAERMEFYAVDHNGAT